MMANNSSYINVRRDVGDKYYRYKMPKLISKIEGRGNGIKTVIPNMVDVAKALHRSPKYTTKFFGCELGSQVTIDLKNDKYIVNGSHDAEKLQSLLDVFIQKFVLCPSCLNPETDLEITKDEDVYRNCKACGAVKLVDMRHKLVAYILKNPEKPSKSKKDKKSKKAAAAAAGSADGSEMPTPDTGSHQSLDEDDGDGDDELTRRINAEAANLPRTSSLDDGWAEDTSAEAVARRMKELQVDGAVEKLMDDDAEEDGDDPLEQFADYVSAHLDAHPKDIREKADDLGIKDHKACAVLAQVLFDTSINAKDVEKKAPILEEFLTCKKAQKAMLGGLERFVGVVEKSLLPKVAIVLKYFYDVDLIEEEIFIAWAEKPSKKYVDKNVAKEIRTKAQPFINWLQEAESESEDESDEE